MSFGKNLQFLRKMHNAMTQEELAEKMEVSRQTISKWELDCVYPEISKVIKICDMFSCSMDDLFKKDMYVCDDSYSNIRIENVEEFRYIRYAVISIEPEQDAINHIKDFAEQNGILNPQIIGWDFPVVSQEQINVFHMHGYTSALILPSDFAFDNRSYEIISQRNQKYAAITIKEPFKNPFRIIPDAYKTLFAYIKINGLKQKEDTNIIPCFEKEYNINGTEYMDIYIAIE